MIYSTSESISLRLNTQRLVYSSSHLDFLSTESDLAYDKFKKMKFVKASMIHNSYESVKYDDQTSGQLNQKGKAGTGYIRLENSKPSWQKNRLDKDKEKAGSKSYVLNQFRRGSKTVKSVWVKVQPQLDLNGPYTKPKLNRSHKISAYTLMDAHTGKTVKVIQVWVLKGVIRSGPNTVSRGMPYASLYSVVVLLFVARCDQEEHILSSVPAAGDDVTNAQDNSHQLVSRLAQDAQAVNANYQLVFDLNMEQQSYQLVTDNPDQAIQQGIQAEQGANPIGSDLRWNRNHPPEHIIGVGLWMNPVAGIMRILRHEYTSEDKKKANLDNVARDILYKTLDKDKNMFSKIKTCATAKDIWEKQTQICEGSDETKENKMTVAQQQYESIKMNDGETMTEFDERFSTVVC
ncbi:hypothetical protein F511_34216 [Dorcoceras hygrometricum]|uniref:Uncharacterized protein n=1 Tax=Dorcoceras hygrometricum TaxID=472368 RepID=A0A2Z7BGJ1_9LAMI|nr:hypothetical protein F511_34216 [Dorcoceras hygrometricum]